MVDNPQDSTEEAASGAPRRRLHGWRKVGLIAVLLIGAAALGLWAARDRLVEGVIDRELAALDLPASYDIESIAPGRQVLTNVFVGNAEAPDLTVERVVVELSYGFGLPSIGRVTLDKPRLYGTYGDDGLSFGSLDTMLFSEDDASSGLPALDVTVNDGRALIETPYGPFGAKLHGGGDLSGGFAAMLAVNAPALAIDGCRLSAATAYGELATTSDSLGFTGPIRLREADCPERALAWQDASLRVDARVPTDFASADIRGVLASGRFSVGESSVAEFSGPVRLGWRDGALDATLDLEARNLAADGLAMRAAALETSIRVRDDYGRIEADGEVSGEQVNLQVLIDPALASLKAPAAGTLLEPLLAKLRSASARQLRDTSFAASFTARSSSKSTSVVVPAFELRSAGGAPLVSASQLQYSSGLSGVPRFAGNFRTGGAGLPALAGRMERKASGATVFRVRMEPYAEGANRLAVPEMAITQGANGTLTFAGVVEAGGKLPGGSVRNLTLPVDGRWEARSGLALWDTCTTVGFDRLQYANLVLSDRDLRVCPASGKPILFQTGGNLRIAAGVAALDLSGTLADTPIRLKSGPVGFAYPGTAIARNVDVALGPVASASRFTLSGIEARFDTDGGVSGTFSDTRVALAAVPLDLVETSGNWRYAGSRLAVTDGAFRLIDRAAPARFNPLIARDATLSLADNAILANADLRHSESDRIVTDVAIRHDLSNGSGNARLAIEGLRFDRELQPDALTDLALGVVANVEGVVTGSGRIDWNAQSVTSSGEFSSDGLDLAAVFGPVRGARGTIVFADLLSLTTAPDQQLQVASINPGIEVRDGTIDFSLRDGQLLGVTGGSWPFMGGTLHLHRVDLNLGVAERRRYVLEVKGLDAAIFVQTLELGNIAATGTFDGELPIVFDELGNGYIERGILNSRPPGGNLSYVGELTYEDLTPMANFAFEMLRSLDFRTMEIVIEGPLTGEIVSKIRIDGVRQGETASRNLITRQLEDVPIQFNVNINAPFYKLIGSLKAMYDPASIRDPRELGLLNSDGTMRQQSVTAESVEARDDQPPSPGDPPSLPREEPAIQRRESE
jgi:hypothetical protein